MIKHFFGPENFCGCFKKGFDLKFDDVKAPKKPFLYLDLRVLLTF